MSNQLGDEQDNTWPPPPELPQQYGQFDGFLDRVIQSWTEQHTRLILVKELCHYTSVSLPQGIQIVDEYCSRKTPKLLDRANGRILTTSSTKPPRYLYIVLSFVIGLIADVCLHFALKSMSHREKVFAARLLSITIILLMLLAILLVRNAVVRIRDNKNSKKNHLI